MIRGVESDITQLENEKRELTKSIERVIATNSKLNDGLADRLKRSVVAAASEAPPNSKDTGQPKHNGAAAAVVHSGLKFVHPAEDCDVCRVTKASAVKTDVQVSAITELLLGRHRFRDAGGSRFELGVSWLSTEHNLSISGMCASPHSLGIQMRQ